MGILSAARRVFSWRSNDVPRDLRGCLSVSTKIDLTPHSLHHSAGGIGAPPSSCSHTATIGWPRMLARNATSYVPLAERRDAPARLTSAGGGYVRAHNFIEAMHFKDFMAPPWRQRALYRWNARRGQTRTWSKASDGIFKRCSCTARRSLKPDDFVVETSTCYEIASYSNHHWS